MPRKPRHVIVGGGISGLLHAWYALQRGEDVVLFEASERLGGLIATKKSEYGMIETAANGILNSRLFEELCGALGLSVVAANKAARRRYIYHQGRPRRLPLDLFGTLRLLTGIAVRDARPLPNESLAKWAARVLGEKSVDALLQPAFGGIYAGDVQRMDAGLVLQHRVLGKGSMLWQMQLARKKKRNLRPMQKGLVSLKDGMGSLTAALGDAIRGRAELHLQTPVSDLEELRQKTSADRITLCVGLRPLLKLLRAKFPELSQQEFFGNLRSYNLATITRFGTEPLLGRAGFGLLFQAADPIRARGVLFTNVVFENRAREGVFSESWIYGGALDPGIAELDESEILRTVETDRRRILPESSDPLLSVCHVWNGALPAYEPPLRDFNLWLDRNLPPDLRVEGNFRCGIGLSAILERAAG